MRGEDTWNLDPPPDFQGFREDLPMRIYMRNLPHWRQQGATYFVTFRLADSIPSECSELLRRLRKEWLAKNPPPQSKQALDHLLRVLIERVEYWLDQGMGSCKAVTAKRINKHLNQSGTIWQQESYDRIVRDSEHLWRCLQYIGRNPRKAGRSCESCRLWVNPEWEKLGWAFVS